MKIAVFGYYTTPNLGNEASAAAIIKNIAAKYPQAEIICISVNPDIAKTRYQLQAFPLCYIKKTSLKNTNNIENNFKHEDSKDNWRKIIIAKIKTYKALFQYLKLFKTIFNFLRKLPKTIINEIYFIYQSNKRLRNVDALFVAGCGTLDDLWDGPWGHPYTLFKWALLAKLNRCQFNLLCCGAVPLQTRSGAFFIKNCLKLAEHVAFRDQGSKNVCSNIGFHGNSYVYPDIAHSLPLLKPPITIIGNQTNKKLRVGINPVAIYGDEFVPDAQQKTYKHYVTAITEFVQYVVEQNHQVIFYATHPRDEAIIDDIMQLVPMRQKINVHYEVAPLIEQLREFDVVVASRFHGIIFPLALCIPTISVSKEQKQIELMRDYNLAEYELALEKIDSSRLTNCFDSLIKNRISIHQQLLTKKHDYLKVLDNQYDALLNRIPQHEINKATIGMS